MKATSKSRFFQNILPILIALVAVGITWHFLSSTPAGCYQKIFSIGSSLCHQIPSHGFQTNGIPFPVCARCSGLYLGSFIGLAYGFLSGKKTGLPKKEYLILLAVLFFLWGLDGANSFISDFINHPFLHTTTNTTRLVTGFGMGLLMATALATLFNTTIWKDGENTAVLRHPLQVVVYTLLCGIISLLPISNIPLLFTISAYIVIFTALGIISLLYTIFWVIIFRKENSFPTWKSLWGMLTAGFSTAMLQVILLNTLRSNLFL